jgi:hypothetical protein
MRLVQAAVSVLNIQRSRRTPYGAVQRLKKLTPRMNPRAQSLPWAVPSSSWNISPGSLSDAHFQWFGIGAPADFSDYRTQSGHHLNSTIQLGSGSIQGCQAAWPNYCSNGFGW